jgi:hypothetical protein
VFPIHYCFDRTVSTSGPRWRARSRLDPFRLFGSTILITFTEWSDEGVKKNQHDYDIVPFACRRHSCSSYPHVSCAAILSYDKSDALHSEWELKVVRYYFFEKISKRDGWGKKRGEIHSCTYCCHDVPYVRRNDKYFCMVGCLEDFEWNRYRDFFNRLT